MKPLIAGDRANDPLVRHFRQIMVWPVQVLPPNGGDAIGRPWEVLEHTEGHPWREVDDEFTGDPRDFQARHYHEFEIGRAHV